MTESVRQDVITEDLERAAGAFRAAEALRDLGLIPDAFNRLYYAAFYLVRALLATEGVEAKSHRGVHSLLGLHFVKSGRLEAEHQQAFKRLDGWRDAADYERGFKEDPQLLRTELEAFAGLRGRVFELIRAEGFTAV